ncbi:hypothetical protein [Tepidibacter aestuarii]|nr:hypothetical protein [Tepidibacter aestuarii]CAH2213503.1 protein of unknown function [Tepidibacter aestuarii]
MKKDITSRVIAAADIPDSLKIIEKMMIYQNTKNRGNKKGRKDCEKKK